MAWIEAIRQGNFTFGPLSDDESSDLQFDASAWEVAALGQVRRPENAADPLEIADDFATSPWKLFNDALKAHQQMVLTDLLPACQLPQDYPSALQSGL